MVIFPWLFGTKTGRTVLLAGSIALGALLSWWAFSSHYESVGYNRCKAEQANAINDANKAQLKENKQKDKASTDIAKDASANAGKVVDKADAENVSNKKEIEDVYRKPPTTAPISLGSCVHPVDQRVQDRIDRAIEAANR